MTTDGTLLAVPKQLGVDGLEQLVGRWPSSRRVCLAFGALGFAYPSGVCGLACLAARHRAGGHQVDVTDLGPTGAITYCERVGLSGVLGVDALSAGTPRAPFGRFSCLRLVDDIDEVDEAADDMLSVVAAEADDNAKEAFYHVVTEALNNVCQHSGGVGYCASQFYPSRDEVRFAIVDGGRGLRAALTRYDPADDSAAIDKALEIGVTGRDPQEMAAESEHMRNRGVGLTTIRQLVQSGGGRMVIWSGAASVAIGDQGVQRRTVPNWQGTLISIVLPRRLEVSFDEARERWTRELLKVEKARQSERHRRRVGR